MVVAKPQSAPEGAQLEVPEPEVPVWSAKFGAGSGSRVGTLGLSASFGRRSAGRVGTPHIGLLDVNVRTDTGGGSCECSSW